MKISCVEMSALVIV